MTLNHAAKKASVGHTNDDGEKRIAQELCVEP
jgi:hypothetical protein